MYAEKKNSSTVFSNSADVYLQGKNTCETNTSLSGFHKVIPKVKQTTES